MSRRNIRRISLWLVMGLAILSCASPVLVTPPPAPPVGQSSSIETIIAQTAIAAQTQTALVLPPTQPATITPLPTKTATITPTATPTVLFLFLTETATPDEFFFLDERDDGGGGEGGDSSFEKPVVQHEWACRIISRSPAQGIVIRRGATFSAIWTVENTGTKVWPKKGVDVVYASGADVRDGKPYIDIPAAVGPGGRVTIRLTLTAPNYPKEYSTRWSLRVGKREFCGVRFVFEVQ